ncbi:MAG: thiol protease/hemagglutinin PrtT [Bacteroidales bacterium]|nr:thiol protease/hemagglutinin PrtT [Bacteroidales bacterium]
MKRSLLLVILFFVATLTFASNPVTQADARLVAKNFLIEMTKNTAISLSDITLKEIEFDAEGNAVFYIFNVKEDGFIIISALDILEPVLGYSVSNNFEKNEIVTGFLDTYKEEIQYAKSNNIVAKTAAEQWATFTAPDFAPTMQKDGANDIEPMVTAMWNQPRYFNHSCPIDNETAYAELDGRAYVGCVAVTMSNLMNYYRYPQYGSVSVSYYHPKYGSIYAPIHNFKYNYDATTSGKVESYQQVLSDLLFHTGVSVQMDYGGFVEGGSGAQSQRVGPRMSTHFGFYPGELIELEEPALVEELNAHRVVYMSGNNTSGGGHAWICDGYVPYNGSKRFHMNWGWGGASNGFYLSSAIGEYNANKQIYVHLAPDSLLVQKPTVGDTTRLDYFRGNVCDGAGIAGYRLGITRKWIIATANAEGYTLSPRKIKLLADDHVFVYAYRNGNLVSVPVANWSGTYLMPECTGSIGSTYVGTPLPADLNVTADSLLIEFVSTTQPDSTHIISTDFGTYFTGININFVAKYPTAAKQYCRATTIPVINTPSGCISDKYESEISSSTPYRAETTCTFSITPGGNHHGIEINFGKFDLKKGDFIDIISGTRLKYSFDINNVPQEPFYVAGPVLLYFKADNVGEGTGFELCWEPSTKIANNSGLENISIYPNPATDKITVDLTANNAGKLNFQIVDLTGKVIRTDVVNHLGGELNHEIYVNDLSKGMYLVKITSDKGQVTHKFIVQ